MSDDDLEALQRKYWRVVLGMSAPLDAPHATLASGSKPDDKAVLHDVKPTIDGQLRPLPPNSSLVIKGPLWAVVGANAFACASCRARKVVLDILSLRLSPPRSPS